MLRYLSCSAACQLPALINARLGSRGSPGVLRKFALLELGQVGTGVWLVYATFPRDNVLSTWLVWLRRERGTGWVGWFADKRDIPVPLD